LRGRRPGIIRPKLQLLHLLFYDEEVVFGQKMQVALKGQIPVLRRPAPNIIQPVSKQSGLDILVLIKDYLRLDTDSVLPAGAALLLPGKGIIFLVAGGDRGCGSEAADVR